MKEARIIFPEVNGLQKLAIAEASLGIIGAFGGLTTYKGGGSWTDPKGRLLVEDVSIVDIAYDQTEENDRKLFDIAWHFGHATHQMEVYLRYGNGHVQMVQELSCMNNGEFDWNSIVEARKESIAQDTGEAVEEPKVGGVLSGLEYANRTREAGNV